MDRGKPQALIKYSQAHGLSTMNDLKNMVRVIEVVNKLV